ncbi:MAG: hypothetical protein AAF152_00780 [Cyanobacteria bacterium P01_A01_bin.114]
MAKASVSKSEQPNKTSKSAAPAAEKVAAPAVEKAENGAAEPTVESLDSLFSALKTLLTTVDKLQKARQEVGDIKPLMVRMLDGELLSGEELDQLKVGVSNLSRLVRVHGDYQVALEKAQPARNLLDTVLK